MLLGFEEERFVKRTTDTAKLGLIDSSVGDPSSATTPSSIGGTGEEFTSRSYFGRINYAFDSRYLFEVNMRYDGSSRLLRIIAGDFFHLSLPDGESVKRNL